MSKRPFADLHKAPVDRHQVLECLVTFQNRRSVVAVSENVKKTVIPNLKIFFEEFQMMKKVINLLCFEGDVLLNK
ncbi:hypothetical protein [Comamonas testosteroni]|uniref:hypothetical protein n=1 Tax=Comamonas testosteroni TaxID=285 RepID=UPI0012D7ACE9|nr:hypothetical protein [Comamonas testosteroni]